MDTNNHMSEKGQAIVYLVLGLVVFLGFVAMAIDGGMVLSDRRHLQNSADAGSLAGAGMAALSLEQNGVTDDNWNCQSNALFSAVSIAETTANTRTDENITNADSTIGVNATCNQSNKYLEVTVDVNATTPSNFLQIVFPNAMQNAVDAVTRVYPRGPLAYGNAIVALNPDITPCNMTTGAGFSGTADTVVNGGGIFSNGCLVGGGGATVTVNGGADISYNSGDGDYGNFSPTPVDVSPDQIPPSAYAVEEPEVGYVSGKLQCTEPGATNKTAKDFGDLNKTADFKLEHAGLWCITGNQNLSINSGTHKFEMYGVTIYIVENIAVTINGNANLTLKAPVEAPTTDPSYAPKPAIPGLVIYMPPSNTKALTINGDSGLTITGTILAPGSQITINGNNGSFALDSQIIGWNVKVNGTATITVTYQGGLTAKLPTSMDLYR